jgi:hypothetical protein
MNRNVKVGETDALKTRVYFDVRLLDGTPALSETGGQPQVSLNGGTWDNSGISALTSVGFGQYTAQLVSSFLTTTGDILYTRYASGATNESRGDVFFVIDNDYTTANASTLVVDYYGTLPEAEQFFASRLTDRNWAIASPDDKIKALRMATQAIDRLNIAGLKQVDTQILQFPRRNDYYDNSGELLQTFSTDVPQDIKTATYLCAVKFLGGWDADIEINNLMAIENRIGPSNSKYDRSWAPDYIKAGIPSATAWTMIRPYLRDPNEITVVRAT